MSIALLRGADFPTKAVKWNFECPLLTNFDMRLRSINKSRGATVRTRGVNKTTEDLSTRSQITILQVINMSFKLSTKTNFRPTN